MLVCCLSVLTFDSSAERSKDQQGVFIPELSALPVSHTTSIETNDQGALLITRLTKPQAWATLNEALARLQIALVQKDTAQAQLVTEWVLWVHDKKSDRGSSKPPSLLSTKRERHRFEFVVIERESTAGAVVQIKDFARQKEIDVAPDSEYAWLEWNDANPQRGAAASFLRRLQGEFDASISSRFQPAVIAPEVTVPAESETVSAPKAASRQPASGSESMAEAGGTTLSPALPAPPSASPPAVGASPAVPKVQPPKPEVSAGLAATHKTPVHTAAPPQGESLEAAASEPRRQAVAPPMVSAPASDVSSAKPAAAPPPVSIQAHQTPRATPGAVADVPAPPALPTASAAAASEKAVAVQAATGGALIDASVENTWSALLRALNDFGAAPQASDERQHIVSTQWIDSTYDEKNHQFALRSQVGEYWAFNLRGSGLQRHRFQLIVLPVDGGSRSMVYAYHTGYQEQVDRTPDSEQTLLEWVDRETDPAVATAFLRRLRIMAAP
ncbi:hypothetical protein [Thiogranum longum]